MTNGELLINIGLVLDIIGIAIIFKYGPPQPAHEEGVSLAFGEDTTFTDGLSVREINAEIERRRRKYQMYSRVALSLLLLGFLLQLVGNNL